MIKKFYGPPGTGKTEKLIRRAQAYIRVGTPVNKIGYFAFTRKAANEAKNRMLSKKIHFKKKELQYFKTLHSFAFGTLGLTEDLVMQEEHYEDLGKEISIRVNMSSDPNTSPYLTCDNEYFQLILKAREKDISYEDEYSTGEYSHNLNKDVLDHVYVNYLKYKTKHNLIDFNDMIQMFIKKSKKEKNFCPRFKVVFIDEAQDLSPIQWKMYDVIKAHSDDIYLAGDDDQAIFTWAGADVDRFIKEPAIEKVLNISRRVPKSVQQISQIIVSRIMGLRQTKKYHAKDTEGFVCNINNLNNINLLKDKWLILARTVSRTREIAKELKRQGIYFKIKDMKSFSTKLYRCIVNYTKWTKGETIEQTELDDVIECIGHDQLDKNKTWFECFDKASLEEKNYIRLMLGNKEKLDEEPRVQLSTIHAAKGGECENVILVLDNTNKIRKSTERNIKKKDEEHRVWYVGATRAKQNLYLLRSKIARKGYQLYDG